MRPVPKAINSVIIKFFNYFFYITKLSPRVSQLIHYLGAVYMPSTELILYVLRRILRQEQDDFNKIDYFIDIGWNPVTIW